MNKKVVILVIDGLGIGSMEDSKDVDANTLKTILDSTKNDFTLINNLIKGNINKLKDNYNIKSGKLKIGYMGADSLLSHLEIINILDKIEGVYLEQFKTKLKEKLGKEHIIEDYNDFLLIDKKIIVSNNIEGELGVGINVLGDLELVNYEEVKRIAYIVGKISKAPRILAMAAHNIEFEKLKIHIEERKDYLKEKRRGIVVAKLGIYDRGYRIQNIINYNRNSPNLINKFLENNEKVFLIGKTADFFASEKTINMTEVNTIKIIKTLKKCIKEVCSGLIFANIQELDLAGHAQNVHESARILSLVNNNIMGIVESLKENDLLIICADHGNDSSIGHSYHTREYIPIIIIGKNIENVFIEEYAPLSEISKIVENYYLN